MNVYQCVIQCVMAIINNNIILIMINMTYLLILMKYNAISMYSEMTYINVM